MKGGDFQRAEFRMRLITVVTQMKIVNQTHHGATPFPLERDLKNVQFQNVLVNVYPLNCLICFYKIHVHDIMATKATDMFFANTCVFISLQCICSLLCIFIGSCLNSQLTALSYRSLWSLRQ